MTMFLVICFLLIICILIIFLVLKKAFNDVSVKAKSYFVKVVQDHADTIKVEEEKKHQEEKPKDLKEKKDLVLCVDNNNHYEINDLFDIVKNVEDKFNINYEKIIGYFVDHNQNDKDFTKYQNLCKIKMKIEEVGVFNILTSSNKNIMGQLIQFIKNSDVSVYQDYFVNRKKFDLQEFLSFLENEINKYDPHIYVLVGNKAINYDYLGENVKTIFNDKIVKGIRVIYKNVMYDYSLG